MTYNILTNLPVKASHINFLIISIGTLQSLVTIAVNSPHGVAC